MRGLLVIIIFSFLVSCNYNVQKKAPENNDSLADLGGGTFIETKLIQETVLSTCLGCHSGKNQPGLNSASLLRQNADKVWNSLSNNSMPPSASGYSALSSCRKSILRKWLDLGLPERSDVTVGSLPECKSSAGIPENPSLDKMPLNYQTLLTQILQPKCMNCHNPQEFDSLASETLFFPYSEIQGKTAWKSPGATSPIVNILIRTDDERMPPTSSGGPLTSSEIEFIIRWIDAGQPEN